MATKRIDPNSIDEQAILEIVAGKNEHIGTTTSNAQKQRLAIPKPPISPVSPMPPSTLPDDRLAAYEQEFLYGETPGACKSLHIDEATHRRIAVLTSISGTQATVSGFVSRVLEHHFREYGAEVMALLERYYQSLKQP